MPDFSLVVLYVEDPAISSSFYEKLLGRPVVESSPRFAMLPLNKDVMLGLWRRQDVQPSATSSGGGELAFTVADASAVRAAHEFWKGLGLNIVQGPTAMDFGVTFVALDPDGHRLRVFAPA
jgi:catechol 2,3-dioxygenase-like lactoylglutathione lyase family enzyme